MLELANAFETGDARELAEVVVDLYTKFDHMGAFLEWITKQEVDATGTLFITNIASTCNFYQTQLCYFGTLI